ncbi:MAG TPA: indole-3-glycerol phosphate synthase TrpC [Chloroflexota bacterium]|nr:indole-3-glycerol phosphate synthase TrpC [Chloroflexota bacterium]
MILDDIIANKRQELAEAMRSRPLAEVIAAAKAAPPPRRFGEALRAPGLSVIAEVKRKSPAKGVLNAEVDPAAQAQAYAKAGARAISVLTDKRYFDGANADLQAVRSRVDLPILRKDFTVDAYHVYEARAIGADAILLIVGALEDAQVAEFQALAHQLGMDALVEVHNERELERALNAEARILGINNRDLTTMTVDVGTTARLRPLVPAGITLVSESGIRSAEDVRAVTSVGVDAILVGEALMSAGDPATTLRSFLDAAVEVPA